MWIDRDVYGMAWYYVWLVYVTARMVLFKREALEWMGNSFARNIYWMMVRDDLNGEENRKFAVMVWVISS